MATVLYCAALELHYRVDYINKCTQSVTHCCMLIIPCLPLRSILQLMLCPVRLILVDYISQNALLWFLVGFGQWEAPAEGEGERV